MSAEEEDDDYRDGDQHELALEAIQRFGFSVGQVCVHFTSMGGYLDEWDINGYLHGMIQLPSFDRDMVSQSVNELIDDICRGPRAPYRSRS